MTHLVAVDPHLCRFGDTWQAVCLDCHYRGPFVPHGRAVAIAAEHRLKQSGRWRPAR